MHYQVALDPALDLQPADFVQAWNDTPDCRQAAQASLGSAGPGAYDPTLLVPLLTIAGDLMVGIAGAILYDLIKLALAKRGLRQEPQVEQVELPDGTKLRGCACQRDRCDHPDGPPVCYPPGWQFPGQAEFRSR